MNANQLEYAVRLAQVRNFSQLAEDLHISQPALSRHIQGLEREIGVKLFDRTTSPLTLTPAGAYFIEEAKALLYKEDQLLRTMDRFKSGEAGRLTIGVSPFRCMYLMPDVVKTVRKQFPGVQVVLCEAPSAQLRKETAEGKYDFSILNLPVDESVLDVIPLDAEMLVLAVPNTLAASLPSTYNGQYHEVDFADCKDLPFITVGETQEMRNWFDKICAEADTHPPIITQAVSLTTAWALAFAGIGATLLPLPFIKRENFEGRLSLFTLKGKDYTRQPAVVMRHGQYRSEYARYAIEYLKQI